MNFKIKKTVHEKPWDKNLQLFLAAIVALNVIPHVSDVPFWVTGGAAACLLWKVLYLTRGLPLPKRWLLWIATLVSTGSVFYSYQTLFGQEAAGALLVLMASLKLLETNRYRDAMLVIFTSYFLLMSHLLASQSLASTVFMIGDVLLITALMFQVHRRDHKSSPRSLKPALKLLALAVPLWIFLFFIFPRFTTGLWNVKSAQAGTGFSENMDPGSISRLVDSEETAFRAQFTYGSKPTAESLYWRGGILTTGDGLKWSKPLAKTILPDTILKESLDRKSIEYNVWIEPLFQKWIFALDFPVSFSSNDQSLVSTVSRQPGFIYEAPRPLYARTTYVARSVLRAPLQVMQESRLAPFLALPPKLSQRIVDLAKKIKASVDLSADLKAGGPFASLSKEERWAKAASGYFMDAGFRYTKSPGAMRSTEGADQLAEFLFEKRVGFCEHYAAAFATLVRAMGVPSRVVVGFQGGSPNELGGYWNVRKLDAHAWAEIWVKDENGQPGQGRWVRMDPTELIAPMRLQLGGDYYRIESTDIAQGLTSEELRRQLNGGLNGLFRRAEAAWDVVQMRWNAFLLGYDLESQIQMLRALGFGGSAYLVLSGFIAIGFTLFTVIFLWRMRRRAHRVEPLVSDWRLFCSRLEKSGTPRLSHEGPLEFTARAARLHPEKAAEILEIGNRFAELRYGPQAERPVTSGEFHESVRRFSIKPNSRPTTS